jgi:hypothetical protein
MIFYSVTYNGAIQTRVFIPGKAFRHYGNTYDDITYNDFTYNDFTYNAFT